MDFMFINRDASSIALSPRTGTEREALNRHVQTTRIRRMQLPNSHRLRRTSTTSLFRNKSFPYIAYSALTPAEKISGDLDHDHKPTRGRDEDEQDLERNTANSESFVQAQHANPVLCASDVHLSGVSSQKLPTFKYIKRSQSTSITGLSVQEQDPFGIACIDLDEQAWGLLRHYRSVFHHVLLGPPTEEPDTESATFQNDRASIMRGFMEDKMKLHCVLAYVSVFEPINKRTRLYYGHQAIQSIKERLMQPSKLDHSLVYHLYFLTHFSLLTGQFVAAAAHIRGLVAVVESFGGILRLSESIQALAALADSFCHVVTPHTPSFPILPLLQWPPALRAPELQAMIEKQCALNHLLSTSCGPLLSSFHRAVVRELIGRLCIGQYLQQYPELDTAGLAQWRYRHYMVTLTQVQRFESSILVTEVVGLALTMWIMAAPLNVKTLVATHLSCKIKALLREVGGEAFELYPQVVMWTHSLGAIYPLDSEIADWHMQQLSTYMQIGSEKRGEWLAIADSIRHLSMQFFWNHDEQWPAVIELARRMCHV